jgi:mRNA-degrading endonuclease RelE of RelBE toxin-antitoxin system
MPYRITISEVATSQLEFLPVRDQRIIEAGVLARLPLAPSVLSKAIKRLRPNSVAEFELRIGDFRVLYNVEEAVQEVVLLIVGRKVGNSLFVGGEEFHEHRSNPPEPPPNRPPTGAE